MPAPRPPHAAGRALRRAARGLTLLEMLVVMGVLAAVAGVGVQLLTGVQDEAEETLARAEMRNLAAAIRAFRRDTGYWPRQGPFAAAATGTEPADMSQLFVQPNDGTDDILPWASAAGAGWNGPYLSELDAVSVTVGPMGADGAGDPETGVAAALRGVGDTFAAPAVGGYFAWSSASGDALVLGRPILFIVAPGAGVNCAGACLIGFGPDGAYDLGLDDDVVVELGPAD